MEPRTVELSAREEANSITQMNTESNNAQHVVYVQPSAHTTDHDSWIQLGVLLTNAFSCGYIFTFSNLMLVPLGWIWGSTCLLLVAAFSLYANCLLADFHYIGGQRFIRYRDLMGFLFGKRMYYVTWFLQFLTLLLGNMGFILLGGRALKEIDSEFSESPMGLQLFIVITGLIYCVFVVLVPTLSAMRAWLGGSSFLTVTYVSILLWILIKDGRSNRSVDYKIRGNEVDKVFNAFGAIAATVLCNNPGLLPELQSTLRKPVVKNMKKGLYLQFSAGLLVYYGVTIVGYWAYGSSVSEYLPRELSGPKWAKIVINSTAFLQSVVSQHMFAAPIHEFLDTNVLKLEEGMNSFSNIKRRLALRFAFFSFNTLMAAMIPFMGDFVNLCGSLSLVPLTFVFPSMIFIKVKGKMARMEEKTWHWANVIGFSILTLVTTASALKLIAGNIRDYHLFADT